MAVRPVNAAVRIAVFTYCLYFVNIISIFCIYNVTSAVKLPRNFPKPEKFSMLFNKYRIETGSDKFQAFIF